MLFGKKFVFATAFAIIANGLLLGGVSSAISGTVDIEGQKVMTGSTVSEGEFTFELRKPGSDTVLMTTTNDADGNIVFEDVPYSDDDIVNEKYIIYEVTEVKGDDDTIIYDENTGYVVLEFNEEAADDSDYLTIFYAKPTSYEIRYDGLEYNVFHATEEELQGVAYSVLDSRDGSLTFFRDEEGAYQNNQYENHDDEDGHWFYYYTVVQETGDSGFNYYNGVTPGGYSQRDRVKTVRFKDAVRPETMGFKEFSNVVSFDLRKLDTSRMTSMKYMFEYLRGSNGAVKSLNLSGFDTSNVTTMEEMFFDSRYLERIIWGDPDTSKVTNMTRMMKNARIESFDFSKFESDSLEKTDYMFSISSSVPVGLQRIDMSSWKRNAEFVDGQKVTEYTTSNMFYRYDGDFLDITNWGAVYSAEFSSLANVKVVKLCIEKNASDPSPLIPSSRVINIETGEVVDGASRGGYLTQSMCGTYVTMKDESMTFVNRKKAQVEVKKVDEDGDTVEGAPLALKMDGSVIYSWDSESEPKFFSNLAYGHNYEIIEYEAPEGYKVAEPVEFSVSNDGVVLLDGEEVDSIELVDELNTVKVKKVWDDEGGEADRPESVTFELVNAEDEEVLDELTLTVDDANEDGVWVGTFKDFESYNIDPESHELMVIETSDLEKYTVSYSLEGSDESSEEPIVGDRVVVTNTHDEIIPDEDEEEEEIPEEEEAETPETLDKSTAIYFVIGGAVLFGGIAIFGFTKQRRW